MKTGAIYPTKSGKLIPFDVVQAQPLIIQKHNFELSPAFVLKANQGSGKYFALFAPQQ